VASRKPCAALLCGRKRSRNDCGKGDPVAHGDNAGDIRPGQGRFRSGGRTPAVFPSPMKINGALTQIQPSAELPGQLCIKKLLADSGLRRLQPLVLDVETWLGTGAA
jgi:hypothetical protein